MPKTKHKYNKTRHIKPLVKTLNTHTKIEQGEALKKPTTVAEARYNIMSAPKTEEARPNFTEMANDAEIQAKHSATISVYQLNIVKHGHRVELGALKSVIDNLKSRIKTLEELSHFNREHSLNRQQEILRLNAQIVELSQEKDRLNYVTTHLNEVKEYQAKEIAKLTRKLEKFKRKK